MCKEYTDLVTGSRATWTWETPTGLGVRAAGGYRADAALWTVTPH